jgi:predicted HAD superfamily Cof-like phosphohydrolase
VNTEHPIEDAFDLPEDAAEVPSLHDNGMAEMRALHEAFMRLQDLSTQCLIEFFDKMKPSKSLNTWLKLVEEEFQEVCQASAQHFADPSVENAEALLKEIADLNYVVNGFNILAVQKNSNLALSTAFIEHIGNAVQGGMYQLKRLSGVKDHPDTLAEAIRRVHASNLSKLGDDGKPIKRADGKILKGPNYKPPVLTDLVS